MSGTLPTAAAPWDDPLWLEPSDTAWRRGLRLQQGWWREVMLDARPGYHRASDPDRLVVSTIDRTCHPDTNFLSPQAAEAAADRLATRSDAGIVDEDRLRYNLLSSQPLCVNLFGHFRRNPAGLERWVTHVTEGSAAAVVRVELEWAPPPADHFDGGSAFDAFVEYRTKSGGRGFVGVECKYAEHLPTSDVKKVREPYITWTKEHPSWAEGAEARLDKKGLRQFWINTLLAESVLERGGFDEGVAVVAACSADAGAHSAFEAIAGEFAGSVPLRWEPYESIVDLVDGGADWHERFVRRYLDCGPIAHLLSSADPRQTERIDTVTAMAIAERVLADGSVLEQLAATGSSAQDPIWHRLWLVTEELKRLRIDAGGRLGLLGEEP